MRPLLSVLRNRWAICRPPHYLPTLPSSGVAYNGFKPREAIDEKAYFSNFFGRDFILVPRQWVGGSFNLFR